MTLPVCQLHFVGERSLKKEITDTHQSEEPRKLVETNKEGVKAANQEFEVSDAVNANMQMAKDIQNLEFAVKTLFLSHRGYVVTLPPVL